MYRVEYNAALYNYFEHTEYMHIITSKQQQHKVSDLDLPIN